MLKQAIQDMFAQAGCDTPATRSMLGDSGVSEANLMIYLGIIEQRTNEILQVILGPAAFGHASFWAKAICRLLGDSGVSDAKLLIYLGSI